MIGQEINTSQYLLHHRFNGANTNTGSLSITMNNVNSPTFSMANGKFEQGIGFNGTNQRIDITENSGLNIANNLFVKFWYKGTNASKPVILSNLYWTTGVNISGFTASANGLGVCALNSGSGPQGAVAVTNVFDGNWHFIVCSHNTTNGGKIWVDGKLDNTNTSHKVTVGYKSGQKQAFGAWFDYTGSVWNYQAVTVDEFCFASRSEPTDAEVRKWYAWATGKLL